MMLHTDLAFLDQTCPTEYERIQFIINRDGIENAHAWVSRTYAIYKTHLRFQRKEHKLTPYYHKQFVVSCVEFRLFLRNYRKAVDLG